MMLQGLRKRFDGLFIQKREREETVLDKERRILELTKKNQELEKFKFVLEYKVVDFKKQLKPREQDFLSLVERKSVFKKYNIGYECRTGQLYIKTPRVFEYSGTSDVETMWCFPPETLRGLEIIFYSLDNEGIIC
jgi:hypothetical protein